MEIPQQLSIAISIVVGYILGSIPAAYLITRARGVNILETGNGNPGAANVFRAVSKRLGILVLVADVLKGFLAVVAANSLGVVPEAAPAAGAAALLGQWYPVFLRFRGGAGLASAVGAGLGLALLPGLIAFLLALLALLIIRSTGYAAAIGYVGFVLLAVFLGTAWPAILGAALLIVMVKLRSIAVPQVLSQVAPR